MKSLVSSLLFIQEFDFKYRNVYVLLRKTDKYLNATQILNAAEVKKGKRNAILKNLIRNIAHQKMQDGNAKLTGTW